MTAMDEPVTARTSLHHIALVCRDVEATHRFYHDLLGLELIHTESTKMRSGYLRHFFYDLGDGSCIAFFDLHGVGEPDEFDTAISTGLGLPAWVNHVALRSTPERTAEVTKRFEAAGEKPAMVLNHGGATRPTSPTRTAISSSSASTLPASSRIPSKRNDSSAQEPDRGPRPLASQSTGGDTEAIATRGNDHQRERHHADRAADRRRRLTPHDPRGRSHHAAVRRDHRPRRRLVLGRR